MQFQICNSGEVWTSISRVEAHRVAHKRTGALAKMIRAERVAEKQEIREYRRAERGLQAELREGDRRYRSLWKSIRLRPEERSNATIKRKVQAHRPSNSGWLGGASQLPRYSGQIIDRMGRAGIFLRVRYYGSSTKPGVGRRSTLYIWNGAHQTTEGQTLFASNVGHTVEEAVAALEAVELFNRETQDGAKVLFHAIANVPFQLLEIDRGIERMFDIGQRFADEQFGSRDLPFALALHPPSDAGDQRNWHLHLIFSTRPLVRTGDHEWDIGRMMRREIDNPEAFEEMRHLYARIQSEVAQEAGLNIAYTALSNAERGLPNAPQKHLGSARAARVRRGERDEVNESNWSTMLLGEAALLDERLRHEQEQAEAAQALLDRVERRAKPLVADLSAGPQLAIATVGEHAEMVADVAGITGALLADLPVTTALPIANMQPVSRTIANLTALEKVLRSDPRDALAILPAFSAVRGTTRSVDVPKTASAIVDDITDLPFKPSLSVVRTWRNSIATVPRLPAELINSEVPSVTTSLPKPMPAERSIAKLTGWAAMQSQVDIVGLTLGLATRTVHRPLRVPQQTLLVSSADDHDVNAIFRLIDARRADVARHERARRDRIAAERRKAEQARKDREEQRAQEETERQRHEAELSLSRQAEREAADALDAMLKAIEDERIFIPVDDGRCVVDDAVIKRFRIASAVIASGEVQSRLGAIADRQLAEILPVATHASANGGHIVHGHRGWTLSPEAPDQLRKVADAWIHDLRLQGAFAEVATDYRQTRTGEQTTPQSERTVRPGQRELLILAAQQREALTDRWQQTRRFDDIHDTRGKGTEIGEQPPPSMVRVLRLPVELYPGQDR